MKRRSSLRTTLAPIPSTPMASLPVGPHQLRESRADRSQFLIFESPDLAGQELFRCLCSVHAAGGVEHRFDDIVVTRAAADIYFQLLPDGFLLHLAAVAIDDITRRHDHPPGAIPDLHPVKY